MSGTDPGDSRPAKKVKFSPQVLVAEYDAHAAADTVVFHLLNSTTAAELEHEIATGGLPFKCEFYNQVFGDAQEINGYKGLTIDIWLALNSFHCWVDIKFEDKRPGADDVLALLQAWWQQPFTTDRAEFMSRVTAAPPRDFGELGPPISSQPGGGGCVRLYHARMVDTPPWFKELHARMEPLLIFTIDGANFLTDDPKWEVVVAVAERGGSGGQQQLIGYMMLYNFYAWPLNERPRVAQVLVLPPMQGGGHGKAMIAAAYSLARQREAVDLTFEDPAPGLQRLREKLELEMMAACPWLTAAAAAALAAAEAEERRQAAAAKELWAAVQRARQQPKAPAPAQPQAQQQQQQQPDANGTHQAAGGGAGGEQQQQQGGPKPAAAAEPEGRSPASLLVMPHELQRRVTKELKIHKHQVTCVWEGLLFLQASLGLPAPQPSLTPDHPLQEPLQELVMSRLEAAHANMADKHAANKRLVEVEGSSTGEDWFVYAVPRRQRRAGGGAGTLMADTVNVGRHTITEMSADDWSERLQQLAAERMEQLGQLQRLVAMSRQRQRPGAAAEQ